MANQIEIVDSSVVSAEWAPFTSVPKLEFKFRIGAPDGHAYDKYFALMFYPKSQKFCIAVLASLGVQIWNNTIPDDFDPQQLVGRECQLELTTEAGWPENTTRIAKVLKPRVKSKNMVATINSIFQNGAE